MYIEWHYPEDRSLHMLRRLCKMSTRDPRERKRIEEELRVIKLKSVARSILIAFRIKEWIRHLRLGQCLAVGAYGNSQVLYAIGLSPLNPLQYGLAYERVWNPLRDTSASIMFLRVPWNVIPQVIALLQERFGNTFQQLEIEEDGRMCFQLTEGLCIHIRPSMEVNQRITDGQKIPMDHAQTWEQIGRGNIAFGAQDSDTQSKLVESLIRNPPRNIVELAHHLERANCWRDTANEHTILFDCDWLNQFADVTSMSIAQAELWYRRIRYEKFTAWGECLPKGLDVQSAERFAADAKMLVCQYEVYLEALNMYQNTYLGEVVEWM